MIRSAIIARAKQRILQGNVDPLWSHQEWGDFFQDACDDVWSQIISQHQGWYVRRDYTLTLDVDHYDLPSDFHVLLWLRSTNDSYIPEVRTWERERGDGRTGFRIENGTIRLVNWDSALPATLTIDYQHRPNELADWDGNDDPSTTAYEPDPPLNTQAGARLIAKIIATRAKIKDGSATADDVTLTKQAISTFVDLLGTPAQGEPRLLGNY